MDSNALEVEALALWLAQKLGGKAAHHRAKAERMRHALTKWYGAGATLRFLRRQVFAKIRFERVRWRLSPNRTPNERDAEVLGYVSGRQGAFKGKGRYRPQILLIRASK